MVNINETAMASCADNASENNFNAEEQRLEYIEKRDASIGFAKYPKVLSVFYTRVFKGEYNKNGDKVWYYSYAKDFDKAILMSFKSIDAYGDELIGIPITVEINVLCRTSTFEDWQKYSIIKWRSMTFVPKTYYSKHHH